MKKFLLPVLILSVLIAAVQALALPPKPTKPRPPIPVENDDPDPLTEIPISKGLSIAVVPVNMTLSQLSNWMREHRVVGADLDNCWKPDKDLSRLATKTIGSKPQPSIWTNTHMQASLWDPTACTDVEDNDNHHSNGSAPIVFRKNEGIAIRHR